MGGRKTKKEREKEEGVSFSSLFGGYNSRLGLSTISCRISKGYTKTNSSIYERGIKGWRKTTTYMQIL
ncbi:uncharacterized protein G2W53_011889 [Senna tora]|uniref:Uncharacterized protein n=1 Tax=Senna tora TaxID=362788 RepID=A0A834U051_9FABA|nr:uncharacterized protein G2W53_011889 [Senna tora]